MSDSSEPLLSSESSATGETRRSRLVLLPLIVFAAIAALLLVRLFAGDDSRVPSALIGKEVPSFNLPPVVGLEDKPGLSDADLRQGHVTLVNVFASWCAPCHLEHRFLLALSQNPTLAKEGVSLAGIAYKDTSENARRFLGEAGDPFARIGMDTSGGVGIEFGVYGVPETYVVRGDGKVAYKFVGPLDDDTIQNVLLPEIEKARQ